MPTDEELTPDELEQRQAVGPDDEAEDEVSAAATTIPVEADEADAYEQSQTVPADPEEERA
jgi:hypothetical protein